MSDTKNPGDKLGAGAKKTLTLKRGVEQGTVRQSFSHGRSKQVVVEKVKRRVIGAPGEAKPEPAPAPEVAPKRAAKPRGESCPKDRRPRPRRNPASCCAP